MLSDLWAQKFVSFCFAWAIIVTSFRIGWANRDRASGDIEAWNNCSIFVCFLVGTPHLRSTTTSYTGNGWS